MAAINVDDVGQLLQWKLKKKSLTDDAQASIARDLLAAPANMDIVAAELNIPRPRLLRAVLEWAVHMATKASTATAETSVMAFDVLATALTQTRSCALQLPLQSCTQLLSAMTVVLRHGSSALTSVLVVFVHLFENSDAQTFSPQFGVFKPPTGVYSTFLHDALGLLVVMEPSDTARDLMLAILSVSHVLQKHQTNKKKVFLATKQSLGAFVSLRAALHTQLPWSDPVVRLLDTMITDALFDPEHIHGYDKVLLASTTWPLVAPDGAPPAKKPKVQRNKAPLAYQEQLFAELRVMLATTDAVADFAEMLVLQFTTRVRALAAKKEEDGGKRKAADAITPAFAFWLELCAIGVALPADAYAVQMRLLHRLWTAMNAGDLYRVAEDNATQDQLQYLERVVGSIMALVRAGPDCVADETQLMANMVQCSPKILQTHLPTVFALLAAKVAVDAAVPAGAECLRHLLHSYDAMRLVQDLLAALFATPDCAPLCRLFQHAPLDAMLRTAFNNVPAGQLEALWSFLHAALLDAAVTALDLARLQLVRTVFGVFLQEVHVSQHNHGMFAKVARRTFERIVAVVLAAKETPDAVRRHVVSFAGDLLELTDKSLDMTYVLEAVFALPNFAATLDRLVADDGTNALDGILKLAATRVRFLTSHGAGGDEARTMAAFVLAHCGDAWACVTPFLTELGVAAPPEVAAAFMARVCRSSIRATTHSIFLDAAFYEIRPFLSVAPTVFVQLLATAVVGVATPKRVAKALAAQLPALEDPTAFLVALGGLAPLPPVDDLRATLTFLAAVPVPYLPGPATSLLLATLLCLEPIVAADARTAIHAWLTTFFEAAPALDASAVAAIDSWLPVVLQRTPLTPSADAVLGALGPCAAKRHPPLLHRLLAVVADTDADALPLLSRALQCCTGASKAKQVDAFWADAVQPRVRSLFLVDTLDAPRLDLFASVLDFYQLRHKTDADVLAATGRVLAVACQQAINGDVAGHAVLRIVCRHYRALSKQLVFSLAAFGRLLSACIVASLPTALEALLDGCNDREFALAWATLLHELRADESHRADAALGGLLVLLQLDKLHAHKHVLAPRGKEVLGALVDLAGPKHAPATHALALHATAQLLTKQEAFHWHAADVQEGLLVLQPLLALAAAPEVPTGDAVHAIWTNAYLVLLRVLRQHGTALPTYLPHFVLGCNALLRLLMRLGPDESQLKTMLVWASNLTRLYGYMIPHSATFRKHMVYLLAEYFQRQKHNDAVPFTVQETLRPGIYALFDICSKYEKEQLFGTLDATGKVLLKAMDTHYKETHQYTGKV
ncbi:hypothetical protein ACHHYP_02044 [Achlya hypogyna]|uniref:Nucleolar 27S pre-rRNA processing Urb2/Npa2 C-terminal domain-containing protein n=1 Tax=Achlya hypogyna TaxID=1202772 RepID=A0A1V9ZSS2_ACHHY|nr:hypothetical protein ACHHYP_02044 [Achlya hypogyna]